MDPRPRAATSAFVSRYTTAALALGRAKQHWQYIVNSVRDLGSLSYYQLLDVSSDADEDEISSTYYELVRVAHPDRHARERDPKRKQTIVLLYARISEAHRVLSSPDQRREYDTQLKSGAKRLTRDAPKPTLIETRDPKSPQARELFEQAQQMIRDEDFPRARATLDLALQFEPGSAAIRAAIEEATPVYLRSRPSEPEPTEEAAADERTAASPPSAAAKPAPDAAKPRVARGVDRRRHPRLEIARAVRVKCRNWAEFRTMYTRDISRGGTFLRTAKPLNVGTAVHLALALPDEQVIELSAKVAHVVPPGTHGRPAGMGLRFSEMDDERREQLLALLRAVALQSDEAEVSPVLRQLLEELARLRQASAAVALNVPPDADPDVVRKAYLHLAKRSHPDLYCRYPGEEIQEAASEVFFLIRRAYERMRVGGVQGGDHEATAVNGEPAVARAREAWLVGDYNRARTWLRRAVDDAPKNRYVRAAYHVVAGCEARAAGKQAEAQKQFETALVFDDSCEEAIHALSSDDRGSDGLAMFDRIRTGEKSV